jgi:phenylalanyl-tRNA synthetase beta chain
VRLPYLWLVELVKVPGAPETIAATLGLRGFEVASIDHGRQPVIDFEITANRPDCLSVVGLAREAAAAYDLPLQLPDVTATSSAPAAAAPAIEVSIGDAELCPRYCAQVFEVLPNGLRESPPWMRDRLDACGVRAINAIVDVSNYVMLEMGHPTHAFDAATLAGRALRIRRARPGEKLRTLDGIERTLEPDMLVIADAERAQAIGGVMGGASSEIGSGTRFMVLESAYFKPASVRRTSKRLGLKTEASSRFERGADVNGAPAAIARAAALLQQIGAAQPVGPTIDRYPSPQPALTLTLRASRIERLLGVAVPDGAVPGILRPLGFAVEQIASGSARIPVNHGRAADAEGQDAGTQWRVGVPTYRVDVQREVDLIEEIARHDGYVGLPATFPGLTQSQPPPDPRTTRDRLVRQVLTACGMSEAMTFAFIEAPAAAPFAGAGAVVSVANPLSEKYAVLRPSLLPGLIDAAAHNHRREHDDVRLFETGTRFGSDGETRAVAGVWSGAGSPTHWSATTRPVDFYDVKGVVEAVGRALGIDLDFEPVSSSYLVEGRTASVSVRDQDRKSPPADARNSSARRIGLIGQVLPAILDGRGFASTDELFAFELDVDRIATLQSTGDLRAESLPRFPSVVRDLSVLVDSTLPAAAVRGTIRSAAPSTLARVIEFDRYRGKGVPEGRVSLSLRLTFRSSERTLTDAEVDDAMARIMDALASTHGAVRR